MFIKALYIEKNDQLIREIPFRKGLNLIVDETHTDNLQESGNNIGKTTVLRLIDYCLGGKGENIYKDPEFREKTNTQIETFLKNENVVITLILRTSLDSDQAKEIKIRRNFLQYKKKIQEINGNQYGNKEFELTLKEMIFNTKVEKPSFRQIIAKNIRDEKNRLFNTLRVLHFSTTYEEYEALFLFWLGIDTDTASQKQKLYTAKSTEEAVIKRLKKENSESELKQALAVIDRNIEELNVKKNNFSINKDYESDVLQLNKVKFDLNRISTEIGKLEVRHDLMKESKDELEKERVDINVDQLKEIYESSKKYIPELQVEFDSLVKFHNAMLKEKIKYVYEELPELESKISTLYSELKDNSQTEKEISIKLKKNGVIEDLQDIIQKLNIKFEQKGMFEEQLRQWNEANDNLTKIEEKLHEINAGIISLDTLLDEKIKQFNIYFTKFSERLYDEQFILSYDKNDRAYELKISSLEGNLGSGKKKGQIAAFDFAYIRFCEENNIACLRFILHDQIENIHGNQLNTISDISNEIDCQFITPVLRDKMPSDLEVDSYKILSLSQEDKLFRV